MENKKCETGGKPEEAGIHPASKTAMIALRQSIKKSRPQCWKDVIREVKNDPWDQQIGD